MIREIAELTRIEHAFMLAFAVLISETIILGGFPGFSMVILFSLLVPFFSEMGSFALNDYLDVETDRINGKNGPIVRGAVSPGFAILLSVFSMALSIILAFFINSTAFAIAVIFNGLAVAYNWKLKDLPVVGNVFIGITMAIPFIFGNFVVSDVITDITLALAILGFIAGFAREIIKSVQDVEGDIRARNSRTLPVIIGKRNATIVAVAAYLLFLPLTAIPLAGLGAGILATILVAAADLAIVAVCIKSLKGDYAFARKYSLIAFFIGLMGLLVAAV